MGQAKKMMMDAQENSDIVEFLRLLSSREELAGAMNGIARQVVQQGDSSMSEKQEYTVNQFVEGYKNKNVCSRCDNDNVTSLTDYIEIADEGMCPSCQHDMEKIMNE
jgi:hypothetical protein